MFKIFIACPISKYLTFDGMDPNYEVFIRNIYETCQYYSSNVFLALYREKYGKARMEDDVCTPLDFEEMRDSDIVIAFPENSMGVAVELGWASTMKKKILLFLNDNDSSSPLIRALYTITDAEVIILNSKYDYNQKQNIVVDKIKAYIEQNVVAAS